MLDIAAGSGNAAIQAADVVASDLTPELFEPGRRRASDNGPPPPPEGPPVRWGTEEGAHELLDGAFDVACEERILYQRYAGGVDEMTDFFMPRFGPMVMARRALEPAGRWDEFLAAYRELTGRRNASESDDEAALPAAYLLVTGTRKH